MIIPSPPSTMTLELVWISAIILACIVGVESAILLGLRLRLGSFRRLMHLAITSKSHYKTTDKKNIPPKYVKNKGGITKKRDSNIS